MRGRWGRDQLLALQRRQQEPWWTAAATHHANMLPCHKPTYIDTHTCILSSIHTEDAAAAASRARKKKEKEAGSSSAGAAADVLSSIELLIIDRADVLCMQVRTYMDTV